TISKNAAVMKQAPGGVFTGVLRHLVGADATAIWDISDAFGSQTNRLFRRANGTISSPSALASNDVIGFLAFLGYGATGYQGFSSAYIQAIAAQAWTDANAGARLDFGVAPLNTNTPIVGYRIDGAGVTVQPSTAVPAGGSQSLGYKISSNANFG